MLLRIRDKISTMLTLRPTLPSGPVGGTLAVSTFSGNACRNHKGFDLLEAPLQKTFGQGPHHLGCCFVVVFAFVE